MAFPDTTGLTPAPGEAQAATANCQEAAWVEGYSEIRVRPNGVSTKTLDIAPN